MRVVFVSTLERGGPVSHLRNLIPHVAAAGPDVTLVCQSEEVAASFEELGVPTHVAPVNDKFDLVGASRLWDLLGGADVVHTHDRRAGLFARLLGRARRAKVVHTFHGLPEEIAGMVGSTPVRKGDPSLAAPRAAWLLHGYLRVEATLCRLGLVVAPSAAMARFLIAHGLPRPRVAVVHSGIGVRRRRPGPVHSPPRVGTVTNLEPWKGVDVLLDACARLRRPVRLEVWGDGSERPRLEARAAALGIDAVFHGFTQDAWGNLSDIDVFALPSRAENLPTALLEAMATAVPSVATRVGGVPELIVDGESGLLVAPDDASALADAIDRLLEDEAARTALGESAARRVEERFGAAQTAGRMVELYERLCASSR
jgi:glycosyltransferase involved in cell wall biosynthesis